MRKVSMVGLMLSAIDCGFMNMTPIAQSVAFPKDEALFFPSGYHPFFHLSQKRAKTKCSQRPVPQQREDEVPSWRNVSPW